MATTNAQTIMIETTVNVPIEKAWEAWIKPEHIVKWNQASADWHCTKSENDLRAGGTFIARMEAKDGSFGFDFGGIHDEVREHALIASTLGDGRKMSVTFKGDGNTTHIVESFEAEGTHPVDMQRAGWQAILDNYARYAESL